MKRMGMLRKMDDMGRIVIPAQIRKAMELEVGDGVEMYLEDDRLVLKKFAPACVFCGGVRELVCYEGKNLCMGCIRKLKQV